MSSGFDNDCSSDTDGRGVRVRVGSIYKEKENQEGYNTPKSWKREMDQRPKDLDRTPRSQDK